MPLTNGIYFAEVTPRQVGNNPALVFIHGAGGTSLFWPGTLRRFPNHRTISLDLPGHGKSNPPGRQSIQHYSQIIESWLADLSLKQTVLIGYGLGGSIAIQIAVDYPELAQGLVLINVLTHHYISQSILNNLTNPVTAQNTVKNYIQKTLQLRASNINHRAYQESLLNTRPAVLAGDLLAQNEKIFSKLAEHISQPVCIIENKSVKDQLSPEQNHALRQLHEPTIIFAEQNSQLLPIDESTWTASQIQSFLCNIKVQQSLQANAGYYLDLNEEGSYAIRTDQ
jgi:pimeloyl-ACP methyl ester carboxylesterase